MFYFKLKNIFNILKMFSVDTNNDSILPLAYKDPFVKDNRCWICDYDENNKIVSLFIGKDEGDDVPQRFTAYLPNLDEVKKQEELLKNEGWVKCKKPEITITEEQEKEIKKHIMTDDQIRKQKTMNRLKNKLK